MTAQKLSIAKKNELRTLLPPQTGLNAAVWLKIRKGRKTRYSLSNFTLGVTIDCVLILSCHHPASQLDNTTHSK